MILRILENCIVFMPAKISIRLGKKNFKLIIFVNTEIIRTFVKKIKTMEPTATARFDARLPLTQKIYFEKAAQLGGYRNLTEFILSSVMEKAKSIISQNEQTIVSQRDSEIFFQAILQQTQPHPALVEAADEYNQLLAE